NRFFTLFLIALLLGGVSCKKLVEVPAPVTSLSSDNVYTNDATAAAVLTGIYTQLSMRSPTNGAASINSISLAAGLSADELTLFAGSGNFNTPLAQLYLNKLTPGLSTTQGGVMWDDFYSKIYICNIALERLAASKTLTPSIKQQLTGEAKFLRAFFYCYLVNFYGDVPLTTTSNYGVNAALGRTDKAKVYQQVIADLKDAQNLLTDGYVAADAKTTTMERVRPNKWAATALLARVYLYTGDWSDAEAQATAVISNSSLFGLVALNNVFLKNNNEAIWQLQPVNTGWNTEDARFFILPATGPTNHSATGSYPVYLSSQVLSSFDAGDQRRANWIDSVTFSSNTYYYPYKYKSATYGAPVTEYTMVLRLGEQYLIRAEAEAENNDSGDAI